MNLLEAIELHLPRGYTIQAKLGDGATSDVYLATGRGGQPQLAVKVMLQGTVNDETVDRFLREMQVLKTLDHPRIVPLLEPGEANGALFFTMPYIEGETLRARLQARGRLPVREALLVARDVGDALGYVHARGVVHRDVKPENIFVTPDGARLFDFGYATWAADPDRDAWGRSTVIVGTAEYMSPEQVSGKRATDWRSDYYSLGCVLYEMLAGAPPFLADSRREAMARRVSEGAPDVRTARPDVPADVAAIVARMLAGDPNGRYPTAGFLRQALDAAVAQLEGAPSAAATR